MGPVAVLAALIALVLPAGVLAATTVGGGGASGDRRVSAAGFAQEGVAAGQPPAPRPVVTTATTAPAPTTTAAKPVRVSITGPTSTTATTVRPQATTGPTLTVPPGLGPTIPSTTVPGGSSWSNTAGGMSVRMHMVPASPVAGRPVTFYVDDLIAQDPCCAAALMFGDSPTFYNLSGGSNVGGGGCESPTSLTGLSVSHTYTAPGAYEAVLATATFPCWPSTGAPPGASLPPPIHGVGLHVCVVVGPGNAGAGGCPDITG